MPPTETLASPGKPWQDGEGRFLFLPAKRSLKPRDARCWVRQGVIDRRRNRWGTLSPCALAECGRPEDKTRRQEEEKPRRQGRGLVRLSSSGRGVYDFANSAATSSKKATHRVISGTELSQLYSYSIEKTPLNFCR
jgi:hypothetical protein